MSLARNVLYCFGLNYETQDVANFGNFGWKFLSEHEPNLSMWIMTKCWEFWNKIDHMRWVRCRVSQATLYKIVTQTKISQHVNYMMSPKQHRKYSVNVVLSWVRLVPAPVYSCSCWAELSWEWWKWKQRKCLYLLFTTIQLRHHWSQLSKTKSCLHPKMHPGNLNFPFFPPLELHV